MSGVINKQKESLIKTIKEAEQSEKARVKRLATVTSKDQRQVLLERFEKERAVDQARIENLSNDLSMLKEKISTGEFKPMSEHSRSSIISGSTGFNPTGKQLKNRWVGLESHNEIIFYGDIVRKFNRHDESFRQKQDIPIYNDIIEKHQLKLLGQKRDLLKQLMVVHVTENGGVMPETSGRRSGSSSSSSHRGGSFTPSLYGGSTTASQASYATFATSNITQQRPANSMKKAPNVPRLNLG